MPRAALRQPDIRRPERGRRIHAGHHTGIAHGGGTGCFRSGSLRRCRSSANPHTGRKRQSRIALGADRAGTGVDLQCATALWSGGRLRPIARIAPASICRVLRGRWSGGHACPDPLGGSTHVPRRNWRSSCATNIRTAATSGARCRRAPASSTGQTTTPTWTCTWISHSVPGPCSPNTRAPVAMMRSCAVIGRRC